MTVHGFIFSFQLFFWITLVNITICPLLFAGASMVSFEGTFENPIVDSKMSQEEAFDGLDEKCPAEIRNRQKRVTVKYFASDKKIHQGQLVIDGDLENDIKTVFDTALKEGFPIHSLIPISDKRFRKEGCWDDDLSMEANNTSGFNYRQVTGGSRLSKHALGRAIDINPFRNPYIKGSLILPKGAVYNPKTDEGALTADHPVVRSFLRLGWEWGGNWTRLKDYQHFEKPLQ